MYDLSLATKANAVSIFYENLDSPHLMERSVMKMCLNKSAMNETTRRNLNKTGNRTSFEQRLNS